MKKWNQLVFYLSATYPFLKQQKTEGKIELKRKNKRKSGFFFLLFSERRNRRKHIKVIL